VIRELPVAKRPGLFRPLWDMRVGAPFTGAVDTSAAPAGGRGFGGGGGGGFGGFGGFNRGPATYMALPGSYTARLTITPATGTPTVLTQRFTLLADPEQPLSGGELKALDDYRQQVVRFQKRVTDAQGQADSVIKRYVAVKKAADSAGTKATPAIKEQLAAIEKALGEFVREIGASGASRAALGRAAQPPADEDDDRSAGGAPDMSFTARAGALNAALNGNFPVSSYQRSLMADLGKELDGQLGTLAALRTGALAKVAADLKAAGVNVP
jgi:hypothetical protein